jgi:hypothetical protein
MEWDELARMKRIIDDTERLTGLRAPLTSKVSDTMRQLAGTDVGTTYAAQYAAQQRLEADQRQQLLATSLTAGATHAALYGIAEHLAADKRLRQLASGIDIGATLATMQIAEQARFQREVDNVLGGGVAASIAAAEEARLQQLVNSALCDYLTSANQAQTITHSYSNSLRAQIDGRFLLPEFAQTERMLDVMRGTFFGGLQDRYGNELPDAQAALLAMQAPWLDVSRAVYSMRGMVELQAIGGALAIASPYSDDFSNTLRCDLGDWRNPISSWSPSTNANADIRRSLYVERGFNTNLTEFPDDAFDESLAIAGIKGEAPTLAEQYGQLPTPFISAEEGAAMARSKEAYDYLQLFEYQLRVLIDEAMTKVYGTDWPKKRLAPAVYEGWVCRKLADKGMDRRLIHYADYTEYVAIICKRDHWREVFEVTFKRPENVQESFQRMYPIRLAIAHTRPIDKEDKLTFYVETKRLLKAMQLPT